MSSWYLDISAALKLLIEEAESFPLAHAIDTEHPDLVACLLLETEMRRAAHRLDGLSQNDVAEFLDGIDLYEVPPSLFTEAGLMPGNNLRSLDALHLLAAVRIGVDQVVTYDERMAQASHDLGLAVVAPG